ncbi:membrane protein [Tenacibaculum sp. KUL113]|uniref:DUF2878 domain-containing protein n=1 Tax=Alteromonas sp. KUL150 TaxID=2480805 RepID=UPI0012E58B05|nr:DUF2878 domain-containing protein [Alteromonas sp. KUL150]GFD72390.1 membrane protein [Tenacibaculum sp. KUL113]GFD85817.1 membrane protein [Alteromonas sp. KUL150]
MNTYNNFHNFLWFQSIWFIAILGGQPLEWALVTLIASHLYFCKEWITELKLMAFCVTIGVGIDGVNTWFGVFEFNNESQITLIPIWLVAIWCGFIGTLRHSLRFMTTKPWLITLASGISAPLSYLGAMRLGAVEFPLGVWTTSILISISWMLMMPIFLFILRTIEDEDLTLDAPQISNEQSYTVNKQIQN